MKKTLMDLVRSRNGQKVANKYFSGEIKTLKKELTLLYIVTGLALGIALAAYLGVFNG